MRRYFVESTDLCLVAFGLTRTQPGPRTVGCSDLSPLPVKCFLENNFKGSLLSAAIDFYRPSKVEAIVFSCGSGARFHHARAGGQRCSYQTNDGLLGILLVSSNASFYSAQEAQGPTIKAASAQAKSDSAKPFTADVVELHTRLLLQRESRWTPGPLYSDWDADYYRVTFEILGDSDLEGKNVKAGKLWIQMLGWVGNSRQEKEGKYRSELYHFHDAEPSRDLIF
ncbi:hypothetical protein EV359DRAFT_64971 [Lentinula novae-zelandiae]|nr:hypothetical protein EV359DRAFT_64971 [Lentinula novae-zelandiae]